ncbi:MAG: hypothetical protein ACI9SP_004091 [Arenicella sp.]|jgi:hypothetical protein
MIDIKSMRSTQLLLSLAIFATIIVCTFSSAASACLEPDNFDISILRGEMPEAMQIRIADMLRDDTLAGSRLIGFHGTSDIAAESILSNGYDPDLILDNTAQLGPGLYTSTNFNVSVDYATGGAAGNAAGGRDPAILLVFSKGLDADSITAPSVNREGYPINSNGDPLATWGESSPFVRDFSAIYAPLHVEISPYNASVPVDNIPDRLRLAEQLKINPRAFRAGSGVTIEFRKIDLSVLGDADEIAKYAYIYRPEGYIPGDYNPNPEKYFPGEGL